MAAKGAHIDFMFLGHLLPGRWIRYCISWILRDISIGGLMGQVEGCTFWPNFHFFHAVFGNLNNLAFPMGLSPPVWEILDPPPQCVVSQSVACLPSFSTLVLNLEITQWQFQYQIQCYCTGSSVSNRWSCSPSLCKLCALLTLGE